MKTLTDYLRPARRIAFLGGAGVSTASQIPDFRSATGLYAKRPEYMLSHGFFMSHPDEFFDFYFSHMIYPDAKPNGAHLALSHWQEKKDVTIIAQNIDGLHQMAGSKKVLELHGSVYRNHCMKCHHFYDLDEVMHRRNEKGIPICDCGAIIKPDVVLYEEGLDETILRESIRAIEQADVMIVGGTSLSVYPAAGLVHYFHGDALILLNQSQTSLDAHCDFVSRGPIDRVMAEVDLEDKHGV